MFLKMYTYTLYNTVHSTAISFAFKGKNVLNWHNECQNSAAEIWTFADDFETKYWEHGTFSRVKWGVNYVLYVQPKQTN